MATLAAALMVAACSGGGGSAAAPVDAPVDTPVDVKPPPIAAADITVLMMGNSHTSMGELPRQLADLLRSGRPGQSVSVVVAPGWMFLDERLGDAPSMALLRSRRWTAVVLQAQRYSSSGQFSHSTAEAEALIRITREGQALPVLFAEWPRWAVDETSRIDSLHTAIATREAACVPAIGPAWDLALARHPGLKLHLDDGNHANEAGAQLAALMLYAGITGASPLGLPNLDVGVDPPTQQQLRQVAGDTLRVYPARRYCPVVP